MRRVLFGMILLVAGVALFASSAVSQPPGGKDEKGKGAKGAKGSSQIGTVFPPALVEDLKLTDDQKAMLADIEKNLKSQIDKLLSEEQKKTVKNFRPAGPGGKGPPPPKGGKGPERPPVEKGPAPTEKGKTDDGAIGVLKEPATIQWYATLERGLAEAKRTGKPILFVSAAPHCAGVSGMW